MISRDRAAYLLRAARSRGARNLELVATGPDHYQRAFKILDARAIIKKELEK